MWLLFHQRFTKDCIDFIFCKVCCDKNDSSYSKSLVKVRPVKAQWIVCSLYLQTARFSQNCSSNRKCPIIIHYHPAEKQMEINTNLNYDCTTQPNMYLLSISARIIQHHESPFFPISQPLQPQSNQTHLLWFNESPQVGLLLHYLSASAWFQYNRLAITYQVFTCVIDFNVYKPVVNKPWQKW